MNQKLELLKNMDELERIKIFLKETIDETDFDFFYRDKEVRYLIHESTFVRLPRRTRSPGNEWKITGDEWSQKEASKFPLLYQGEYKGHSISLKLDSKFIDFRKRDLELIPDLIVEEYTKLIIKYCLFIERTIEKIKDSTYTAYLEGATNLSGSIIKGRYQLGLLLKEVAEHGLEEKVLSILE